MVIETCGIPDRRPTGISLVTTVLISVVIPTHNRPDLLNEAIESVCRQTHRDWEIVIIDDGSTPAVNEAALRDRFDPRIHVVRNDQPCKLTIARDQGVRHAQGEVIVHLDDDDLLAPNALALGSEALAANPELELLYLAVEGFGARADYFQKAQGQALARVLQHAGITNQAAIIAFDRQRLLPALLQSVPMAFQREMVLRNAWHRVSALRRQVYMLDTDIPDEDRAMLRIRPPLRDSEWALYAAASCQTALLTTPVYLQRCSGQGYVSKPEQRERSMLSSVDIKTHLYTASKALNEFKPWKKNIEASLAQTFFDQCYLYFQEGKRLAAYRALFKALSVKITTHYLRFGLRMLLPKIRTSD